MKETNHARLLMCHANPKGTGSAMRLELHPAHGDTDGSIRLVLAPQLTVGDCRKRPMVLPTFDWDNALKAKLDFTDASKILQVLRGECESIEEGKGLFHLSESGTLRILFRHLVDPLPGYHLEVERKDRTTGEERRVLFSVNPAEACGLCEAFAAAIPLVAFGVPEADA